VKNTRKGKRRFQEEKRRRQLEATSSRSRVMNPDFKPSIRSRQTHSPARYDVQKSKPIAPTTLPKKNSSPKRKINRKVLTQSQ